MGSKEERETHREFVKEDIERSRRRRRKDRERRRRGRRRRRGNKQDGQEEEEEFCLEEDVGWQRLREDTMREEESSGAEREQGEESKRQEEIEDEVGEDDETCKIKIRRAPKVPSRAEREEHDAWHLPYRSWCKHCVRGRGRNLPHETSKDKDRDADVGRISMDYFS